MMRFSRYVAVGLLAVLVCARAGAEDLQHDHHHKRHHHSTHAFAGGIFGGGPQNPITDSTITFCAVGGSGCTGASMLATTTSDSAGSFTISSYKCPSPTTQTYITAIGGNHGGGSNSAIGMIALTGQCGSLTGSSFVVINELTTVAGEWALAQFIDSSGKTIGSSDTNAMGLSNAVNLAESDLVVSYVLSGGDNVGIPAALLPTAAQCGSGSPPVNCDGLRRLDTLASIIAVCINSSGPSSTQCQQLFCGATPGATWNGMSCSSTPAPTDTLAATYAIVTHPTSNVSTIYDLLPPPSPTLFEPVLTTAPADWTLALNFAPASANFNFLIEVAIDNSGNAWVTNQKSASVTELASNGSLIGNFTAPGPDLVSPSGVALDTAGNAWVANQGSNSVTELDSNGNVLHNFDPMNANFNSPLGLALDSAGNAWVTNQENDSVTELTSAGSLIGNFNNSNTATANFLHPTGVALDHSGNAWVTNLNNNSVTELAPNGGMASNFNNTNTINANFNNPAGVALDSGGNVWVTNPGNGSVTELASNGSLVNNFSPADFHVPAGVALDSTGNVWVTNFGGNSVVELTSSGSVAGNFAPAGANFNGPDWVALDSGGNAWVTNQNGNSVSVVIGLAAPVLTPTQACLKKGNNVCAP